MLGLLGLRIFEATGADVEALEEVHGHCVLRVRGKGDKVALIPLSPAIGRAIDRAIDTAPLDRSCEAEPATAWTAIALPAAFTP
jgi:integrase